MIVEAASREEVEKMITDDIYVKGKVWESWDIYPWKVYVLLSKTCIAATVSLTIHPKKRHGKNWPVNM